MSARYEVMTRGGTLHWSGGSYWMAIKAAQRVYARCRIYTYVWDNFASSDGRGALAWTSKYGAFLNSDGEVIR